MQDPTDRSRTGHPAVDDARDRLADLDAVPVAEHGAIYDEVEQRLVAAMGDAQPSDPQVDEAGGTRSPTGPG